MATGSVSVTGVDCVRRGGVAGILTPPIVSIRCHPACNVLPSVVAAVMASAEEVRFFWRSRDGSGWVRVRASVTV